MEPENAKGNQVLDARNVWCPEGRLEQRPGYIGISALRPGGGSETDASAMAIYEDNVAATPVYTKAEAGETLTLSDALARGSTNPRGDRLYIGSANDPNATGNDYVGVLLNFSTANSNKVAYFAEYYDGSTWKPLRIAVGDSGYASAGDFWGTYLAYTGVFSPGTLTFPTPADWAQTTITVSSVDYTRYFFRITFVERAGVTGLDSSVVLTVGAGGLLYFTGNGGVRGIFQPQLNKSSFCIYISNQQTISSYYTIHHFDDVQKLEDGYYYTGPSATDDDPATIAVVPYFGEAYVTYDNKVYKFTENTASADENPLAAVEDRDELVGKIFGIPSPFFKGDATDPGYVAQLGSWPQAKYIHYLNGVLWHANLKNEPYTVRWSAAQEAYKVWPVDSFATLAEDDNSPITGLSSLNEHVVVFKQDSLWRMVFVDAPIDAAGGGGTQVYIAKKETSGIGCVSNASIARTPQGLIFLSEDGIYIYNGTPNVMKLSENIDPMIRRINPGRRRYASGVYWATKNVYMLSCAIDGSDANNLVIVLDLKHMTADETGKATPAIWFWDTIRAQCWLNREVGEKETIYFGDDVNRVHQLLDFPQDDNGTATSAYIETHRFGYGDFDTKRWREVRVNGTNDIQTLTVALTTNDKTDNKTSGSLTMTDANETLLTTATPLTAVHPRKRRENKLMFRDRGEWAQVRVTGATKNQPMIINRLSIGAIPLGARS